MIYLKAWRVLKSPSGKRKIFPLIFKRPKWKNSFNEFDIFNPKKWRDFLANDFRLPDGKKLPNFTADKEPIVYQVYVLGTPIWMREHFESRGVKQVNVISLFPGYDENGEMRDVKNFGQIRKVKRRAK